MSDTVTVALISSGPGYIAGLFALLAWLKGRRNEKLIGDTSKKVDGIAPIVGVVDQVVQKLDENTKITEQTHDVVNGQSAALLEASKTIARAEGVLQGIAQGTAEERERKK